MTSGVRLLVKYACMTLATGLPGSAQSATIVSPYGLLWI